VRGVCRFLPLEQGGRGAHIGKLEVAAKAGALKLLNGDKGPGLGGLAGENDLLLGRRIHPGANELVKGPAERNDVSGSHVGTAATLTHNTQGTFTQMARPRRSP
jgi:hypothetical protein